MDDKREKIPEERRAKMERENGKMMNGEVVGETEWELRYKPPFFLTFSGGYQTIQLLLLSYTHLLYCC